MTTLANRKFSKVIDKYLETGNVTVDFDKATLVTTLNGEGFTPAESQQLVQDFGKHPVFKTIMEIVNSSPVASEARSHVNSVKSLQDALAGYDNVEDDEDFEDDIDFEEDIDDLIDDEDDEEEWVQTSLEEFLEAVGEDNAENIFEAIQKAETLIENLPDDEQIVIEIPGIGKAVLSKVVDDSFDEEEEQNPKSLLANIISDLVEKASGIDEVSDSEFYSAKKELDALPKEIKNVIKMSALSELGNILIEQVNTANISGNEKAELIEIVIKMLGEADRISGDNLPEPSDFITAIANTLEQYL